MKNFKKIAFTFLVVFISFSNAIAQTEGKTDAVQKDIFYKVVAQEGSGNYTTIQAATL